MFLFNDQRSCISLHATTPIQLMQHSKIFSCHGFHFAKLKTDKSTRRSIIQSVFSTTQLSFLPSLRAKHLQDSSRSTVRFPATLVKLRSHKMIHHIFQSFFSTGQLSYLPHGISHLQDTSLNTVKFQLRLCLPF